MIVVPKKKHDKIVEELNTNIKEIRREANAALIQKDIYEKEYLDIRKDYYEILEDKKRMEKDKNLLEVSIKRKDDTICKLEFKLEEVNEKLKKTITPIINVNLEACKCKVNKYEHIAKRTKKTRTREKAYNKILEVGK
ncbi:MAG: hypothetical protein ACRCXT_23000 [Paraclostridium sp.]